MSQSKTSVHAENIFSVPNQGFEKRFGTPETPTLVIMNCPFIVNALRDPKNRRASTFMISFAPNEGFLFADAGPVDIQDDCAK
mmetsp:Transcript_30577/g.87775  ORF Transcript_30577/g.87775 Transcript_30577/m.87775 type:complete len:83 (-) Transcript_30577:38-286(-)